MDSSPIGLLDTASLADNPGSAAALLAGVLDSAMDAIITVDENQNIVLYNRAAETIFGWPQQEVMHQSLQRLIPGRFRQGHGEHVERFGTTGATSRRMGTRNVVYGLRANGEEFPLDASISHLDTPNGRLFTVILRDITGRLLAEEEHSRLAALLDSAMDGIITVNDKQQIVMYNRAAEKIFGWPSGQALGQALGELMPERFRAGHDEHVRRFSATGVTSRRMGDGSVIYGVRANGEEFPMDASISQLETADGKLYTVILRDVTERVRAQQERSAFAAAVNAAREEEKTRVARELHDELAQSLTALKMDTLWVRDNTLTEPDVARAKLTDMLGMVDGMVASTRRIAADLRPLLLDDLGLLAAIEWLIHSFSQRTGVACSLSAGEELELQEPYATAVFRIVQEALANVAKHAAATEVAVAIGSLPGEITLSVRDNGGGFVTGMPRKPQSLGLMGLHERAQLLNGRVSIDSAPGQGTRIGVTIPLPEAEATP
ncbi:PAS domain-containing sensor histidine kinase [Polaromonas sp.]|uniref:PAS domain-containing sensor histidine kinase n=1 Tax=Polaromonas sp. TaxID=1869339 RepID=UPI00248831FE|nr:PAS domain-containing sensor histidine kinase [Polaromonas sp.]MDI1339416.1 PAS domain-containing sensor histidine kinase [Polaromonas sp.]